jgi:hypothetical protein
MVSMSRRSCQDPPSRKMKAWRGSMLEADAHTMRTLLVSLTAIRGRRVTSACVSIDRVMSHVPSARRSLYMTYAGLAARLGAVHTTWARPAPSTARLTSIPPGLPLSLKEPTFSETVQPLGVEK